MSYSDNSIKVLKGLELTQLLFKLGDYETLLTTEAIYGWIQGIKECSDAFQELRNQIKSKGSVSFITKEQLDSNEELYDSVAGYRLSALSWYLEGNKKTDMTEMMRENAKVIDRKINGLDKARDNFWKVYNEVDLGYSLNERAYLSDCYQSPISEVAKGEVDREEVKGLDPEDREGFDLDSLNVTTSEELTEEDREEDEREEEARQLEETKKFEQEEKTRKEQEWGSQIDYSVEEKCKELQQLREEFMKASEDKEEEIINKALRIENEFEDEDEVRDMRREEDKNDRYLRENPEEEDEDE